MIIFKHQVPRCNGSAPSPGREPLFCFLVITESRQPLCKSFRETPPHHPRLCNGQPLIVNSMQQVKLHPIWKNKFWNKSIYFFRELSNQKTNCLSRTNNKEIFNLFDDWLILLTLEAKKKTQADHNQDKKRTRAKCKGGKSHGHYFIFSLLLSWVCTLML